MSWIAILAVFVTVPFLSHAIAQGGVRDDYGMVAEGLTAARAADTIESGYRMFSLPDFKAVCEGAHADRVARLQSDTARIQMTVGQPFDPKRLKVVALDGSGAVLPNVPIAIETEMWSKVFEGDPSSHVSDGLVRPVQAGTVRLRIRTICEGPAVETFITARAVR